MRKFVRNFVDVMLRTKMKSLLLAAAATALLCGCRESYDERLERIVAEQSRKMCPIQVEPHNTLDSMTYSPASRTYCYWYTLSGPLDEPAVREEMARKRQMLHNQLLERLRNSVELKEAKEHEVNFRYAYRSASTGKTVLQLDFHPADYRH